MPALWEQDGGQDHDRCHREDQPLRAESGCSPGVGKTWSELVSQRSGIPLALTVGRELGKGDVGLGWEDGRHG
jgi:hypothetical protein